MKGLLTFTIRKVELGDDYDREGRHQLHFFLECDGMAELFEITPALEFQGSDEGPFDGRSYNVMGDENAFVVRLGETGDDKVGIMGVLKQIGPGGDLDTVEHQFKIGKSRVLLQFQFVESIEPAPKKIKVSATLPEGFKVSYVWPNPQTGKDIAKAIPFETVYDGHSDIAFRFEGEKVKGNFPVNLWQNWKTLKDKDAKTNCGVWKVSVGKVLKDPTQSGLDNETKIKPITFNVELFNPPVVEAVLPHEVSAVLPPVRSDSPIVAEREMETSSTSSSTTTTSSSTKKKTTSISIQEMPSTTSVSPTHDYYYGYYTTHSKSPSVSPRKPQEIGPETLELDKKVKEAILHCHGLAKEFQREYDECKNIVRGFDEPEETATVALDKAKEKLVRIGNEDKQVSEIADRLEQCKRDGIGLDSETIANMSRVLIHTDEQTKRYFEKGFLDLDDAYTGVLKTIYKEAKGNHYGTQDVQFKLENSAKNYFDDNPERRKTVFDDKLGEGKVLVEDCELETKKTKLLFMKGEKIQEKNSSPRSVLFVKAMVPEARIVLEKTQFDLEEIEKLRLLFPVLIKKDIRKQEKKVRIKALARKYQAMHDEAVVSEKRRQIYLNDAKRVIRGNHHDEYHHRRDAKTCHDWFAVEYQPDRKVVERKNLRSRQEAAINGPPAIIRSPFKACREVCSGTRI